VWIVVMAAVDIVWHVIGRRRARRRRRPCGDHGWDKDLERVVPRDHPQKSFVPPSRNRSSPRCDVLSGGTASGTIDSGGLDVVLDAANGTMIDSGGTEVLADGGTASGTTVNSGGIEVVASGGTACGMMVNSGGIDAWSAAGLRVAPRSTALA
jgi:autotransporter passenger strand-loop-strand repeat protein